MKIVPGSGGVDALMIICAAICRFARRDLSSSFSHPSDVFGLHWQHTRNKKLFYMYTRFYVHATRWVRDTRMVLSPPQLIIALQRRNNAVRVDDEPAQLVGIESAL
jgi:hypothetical protein